MTEGAASNIFVVRGGRLMTPPKGPLILPGVTRDLVLELARAHGVACAEEAVSEAVLRGADEMWMTGSTKGSHADHASRRQTGGRRQARTAARAPAGAI